jgi:hypothetical protein
MQTLALTPVIELGYYNQGNDMPSLREESSSSTQWMEYRKECMRLAGMPDPLPPDIPGTDFYTLGAFSGARLEWLIKQHISDYIHEKPERINPFYGGYILSDSAGTLINPQCCGDLSDVMWWKHVCYRMECVYYNGHPRPELVFRDNIISFICLDEYDPFDPVTKTNFAVEQGALVAAYEDMLPTLLRFKHSIAQAVDQLDLPNTGILDLSSVLTVNNVELSEQDPRG